MSPGVAILSGAITGMALVLSIFGAAWLNQRNTEKLIEQLDKRFDQRFADLESRFDLRFSSLESRLDRIERQLEALFKPILPPK
jgi:hypothetical protein